MVALTRLLAGVRATLIEWWGLSSSELHFENVSTALTAFALLLAVAVLAMLAGKFASQRPGRTHVVLPALLPLMRRSKVSVFRHGAFLLFVAGIPFFGLALADPHTSFRRTDVTYTGRRIAMLIDGSNSMILRFTTNQLRVQGTATYFTAMAAAERFVRMRMAGPYRDLISVIQFGTQAYVLAPFTTDYDNILLGIRLMGNPVEWGRFPESGTTILRGIDQGLELYKTFDFLDASGNLMLIFSDGRDGETNFRGRTLDEIMAEAGKNHIPIYMLRTAGGLKLGEVREDRIWKPAVERSGGKFFPIADEASLLAALSEIDRGSSGRINVREYTSERPQFSGYVLIAVACWFSAVLLQFSVPWFRTFP